MNLWHTKAWAWEMTGGLCCWAEPTKKKLMEDEKPSPEAKPVRVRLVPEAEYKKLQLAYLIENGKKKHRRPAPERR